MSNVEFLRNTLTENNGEIKFSESLTVRASPHKYPEKIIGIALLDNDIIYEIRENNEMKFLVNADDMVINSICQRVRLLKYKKEIN